MVGNGLGKPFGHPVYHPIYAAAAEASLPVAIHLGGDAVPDTLTHPTAGGLPSTYAEFRVVGAQALMTHLVSLIGQGVFELFPTSPRRHRRRWRGLDPGIGLADGYEFQCIRP